MTPETVITAGRHALEITVMLIAILLVPALVTGLVISLFQAATQINEMTLSFIPKLLVTFTVLLFAGPWMLAMMSDYTTRLFQNIPYMIG